MDWVEEFWQGGYPEQVRIRPVREIEVIPY